MSVRLPQEKGAAMLKFTVFADLHYKKRMYTASVESLMSILRRADAAGVDFVITIT